MGSELDKTMVLHGNPKGPVRNPTILKGERGRMTKYLVPEAEECEGCTLHLGKPLVMSTTTIEKARDAISLSIEHTQLQWGVKRNGKPTDKWAADQLRIPTPEDEEAVREAYCTYLNAHQRLREAKARAYANGKRVTLKVARELFDTWEEVEKRELGGAED